MFGQPVLRLSINLLYYRMKNEQGSCKGDSGGPLIIENTETSPNRYVQIGVVSGSAVCGDERFPGAYARLDNPEISNFIFNTINQ